MNHPHHTAALHPQGLSTRALKTPFSPRMKAAMATGLLVLAASLAPTARAMASAEAQVGQHDRHHAEAQHGAHGGKSMGRRHMSGMPMDGMGLGMGHGRHAERLLDSVGATAEQKAQIRQIGEAARSELQAQRGSGADLREQARSLMTQPEIDANAVEALRQQMLARHDQASKRMSQAMVDMARVLTPDQRQALAQRLTQRHEMLKQRGDAHRHAPAR